MANSTARTCNTCSARARSNRSGRSKCNGKSPCNWCNNKKLACSYDDDSESDTIVEEDTPAPQDETTITLIDNVDGSRTVRFSPDPEGLGEVDAADASDFYLPGDPPIEGYTALVKERKRKRTEALTRVETEAPKLAVAKRIRGGAEGEEGGEQDFEHPPPPPPPRPEVVMAQALQAIATANTTAATSNAATHQMLAQILDRMDTTGPRRDEQRTRNIQSESSRTRHRPDLFDEDHELPMYNPIYPKIVLKIFRDGCREPFSLFLLTDSYVLSPEANKSAGDKLLIGQGNTLYTQAIEPSALVGGKPETELTYELYMQAFPRYIDLHREHNGPVVAEAWQGHFTHIITQPFCMSIWHYLIRYDIEIRRIATQRGFRPQNWHQKVFDGIKARYDQEEVQNRMKKLDAAILTAHTINQQSILPTGLDNIPFEAMRTQPPERIWMTTQTKNHDVSTAVGNHTRLKIANQRSSSVEVARSSIAPQTAKTGSSTGSHSATTITTPKVAFEHPAPIYTSAPSVAQPTMVLPLVAPSQDDIRTKARRVAPNLIPDAWETMLRRIGLLERFGDIPIGLRQGFRIGAAGPVSYTIVHKNHKSALDRPDIIVSHIADELRAGRYSGPYTRNELENTIGPFRTAPLGAVDKASAPGKFRIVQDFSFPRTTPSTSLNSQIDSSDFPCEWGFFHDVVKAIHDLPPGAMAATCDVDAAFRQMPIHPDDRPHTIVMWDDRFYIDAFLPFGVASANGIFGRPGDAMACIYTLLGFGVVLKWVDDFLFIQIPPTFDDPSRPTTFSLDAIYKVAAILGWPWKLVKSVPFSNIFVYLGFEWDIAKRWVSLPPAKRDKYITRIGSWLANATISLNDTEKMVGSLIHCTLAIPDGRPHMAALISFQASFPHVHEKRFLRKPIPDSARADAEWWITKLRSNSCGSSIAKPPPTYSIRIASDASSSFGLGVVIDNYWWSWRLLEGWKSENRDIGWAEAVALELAIDGAIALGIRDASIVCHCDNQGVVYAWAVGRSRNVHQNATFMRILDKAADHGLHINVNYIRSAENPADNPSRGVIPPHLSPPPVAIPIPSIHAPFLAHAALV